MPRRLKATALASVPRAPLFEVRGEVYTQPLLAYIRYTHPPKPHSRAGHGTNVTPPGPHHHTSGSRTRDAGAGGGALPRRLKAPLAAVPRAPLFEVRGERFTHSPYWHTYVTLTILSLKMAIFEEKNSSS